MRSPNPSKDLEPTLEDQFKAKYSWLLRWALHFAHNDAAAAEDLVQETFVRILLLKNTALDLAQIEPLLYTHLRYAYLTERRRGRNYAFQSLTTAEFDTLSISLRSSPSSDQIEMQNELRRILSFSLWRRRAAKSANIFLFRFFHEFTHEEIASICLITRHAVDTALLRSREELTEYLADPQQIRIAGRGAPPEHRTTSYAVASYEFAQQTTEMIFSSFSGVCFEDEKIERWYSAMNLRPLDTEDLSHLVCCKTCLEKVTRIVRAAPPKSSAAVGSKGFARRIGRPVAVERAEKASLERVLAAGRRRMREIYGHRPSELVIAVNGEIVAVRDVSSTRCILKVESHKSEGVELIEVFSDQAVLMALLNIDKGTIQHSPLLTHQIELSGDRTLSLNVQFTVDGALIEMSYLDPHFVSVAASDYEGEFLGTAETSSAELLGPKGILPANGLAKFPKPTWQRWRDSLEALLQMCKRTFVPVLAAAVALILLYVGWNHARDKHDQASDLLRNTVRAERRTLIGFGSGVVHQRVEIRRGSLVITHDLHRDAEGRRRPAHTPEGREERDLRQKLAQADFDWDDPISAGDFDAWRERVNRTRDEVATTGDGLLRLTTVASSGPITQETLTVRLRDLHAVARTMTTRDHESIEVAELSYNLEPWDAVNERFFSPRDSDPHAPAPIIHTVKPANPVNDDDLDIASLDALIALQDLHAEGERIEVRRSAGAVAVDGIVESEARKKEILARIASIPNVVAHVSSYSDLDTIPAKSGASQSVVAISAVSVESPLDIYCTSRKLDRDTCRTAAQNLLTASANLARDEMRLRELESDYPESRGLKPVARSLLAELKKKHIDHLVASVVGLERILQTLGSESEASPEEIQTTLSLRELVEQNRSLTRELVYTNEASTRPAQEILRQLADSTQHIHSVLPRMEQRTAN